jgi:hypothetical protein
MKPCIEFEGEKFKEWLRVTKNEERAIIEVRPVAYLF